MAPPPDRACRQAGPETVGTAMADTRVDEASAIDPEVEAEARRQRRIRREARRERQRALNVIRAEQMHAARLEYEAATDGETGAKAGPGTLSPDPASHAATQSSPAIHVGCSGWFYWHWR